MSDVTRILNAAEGGDREAASELRWPSQGEVSAAQSCNVHALAEKAKLGNEFMSALKRCEVALDCKGRRGLLAVRRLQE